ncbi:MAG: nucleotide pyrophosphatase/phosphodiesterase family protein, partial [Planctomycetota bacterium]
MTTEHLVFLSVPGLRPRDIDKDNTPTLYSWANVGALAEIIPTFPCVTSCVQASMLTGTPPGVHGVIANGFYHRDRQEVEFWVGHNDVIVGEQIWDAIRRRRPGFTSAVWHAQNIKGAAADFIVTPAPIHEPDGKMKLWCYSKPDGLYQQLLDAMGHFPLQRYWGPLANLDSTKWILNAAVWFTEKHRPNLHWIYIPHLDYAAQKFGPNSPQAQNALKELDQCLAEFARHISALSGETVFLVAGEYALTDVAGVVYPNRLLREAGLLAIREDGGREYLDFKNSTA